MQARAVAAVRRRDAEVEAEHGEDAVWVAVSHGDMIKAVLADALGMHLDLFQRIIVDPASVSIVRYTGAGPTCCRPTPTPATCRGWPPARGRRATARGLGDAATDAVVRRRRRSGAAWAASPALGSGHAPLVHGFDPPERFVAGTVGQPGQRTFFLQARSGARLVSVALEKQQVAALAERVDELLDEVMSRQTSEAVDPRRRARSASTTPTRWSSRSRRSSGPAP